mgnify:CR=1 FL=1
MLRQLPAGERECPADGREEDDPAHDHRGERPPGGAARHPAGPHHPALHRDEPGVHHPAHEAVREQGLRTRPVFTVLILPPMTS